MLGFTPDTHNKILLAMKERANNKTNCIDKKNYKDWVADIREVCKLSPQSHLTTFFLPPLFFLFLSFYSQSSLTQPQRSQCSLTESSSAQLTKSNQITLKKIKVAHWLFLARLAYVKCTGGLSLPPSQTATLSARWNSGKEIDSE